jgi:hypothetical protein
MKKVTVLNCKSTTLSNIKLNNESKVVFENGSINNGNAVGSTEIYYAIPKELLDKFVDVLVSFKQMLEERK